MHRAGFKFPLRKLLAFMASGLVVASGLTIGASIVSATPLANEAPNATPKYVKISACETTFSSAPGPVYGSISTSTDGSTYAPFVPSGPQGAYQVSVTATTNVFQLDIDCASAAFDSIQIQQKSYPATGGPTDPQTAKVVDVLDFGSISTASPTCTGVNLYPNQPLSCTGGTASLRFKFVYADSTLAATLQIAGVKAGQANKTIVNINVVPTAALPADSAKSPFELPGTVHICRVPVTSQPTTPGGSPSPLSRAFTLSGSTYTELPLGTDGKYVINGVPGGILTVTIVNEATTINGTLCNGTGTNSMGGGLYAVSTRSSASSQNIGPATTSPGIQLSNTATVGATYDFMLSVSTGSPLQTQWETIVFAVQAVATTSGGSGGNTGGGNAGGDNGGGSPSGATPPAPTIDLSSLNGPGNNSSGSNSSNGSTSSGALATASAGQTFTLTGTGMNSVNQVNVGDKKAIITLKTATKLGFKLPKNLRAGVYDLSLYGSFGSMTEAKFFSVAKKKVTQVVAGFGGNSPALTEVVNAGISRTLARLGGGVTLVCNGSTSGVNVTKAAKELARDRARAACAEAKKANPSLTTKIRISPASAVGAQARNVKLVYRNY